MKGVHCLNEKYSQNPTFHNINQNSAIERHGFIESDERTYFEFHGIAGCYMKWQNGKNVDFNLGILEGVMDLTLGLSLISTAIIKMFEGAFPNITIEDIQHVIDNLEHNGLIIKDDLFNQCYFKEDYDNPNPFRWYGAKYPSSD